MRVCPDCMTEEQIMFEDYSTPESNRLSRSEIKKIAISIIKAKYPKKEIKKNV